jgi:hypothetical protein
VWLTVVCVQFLREQNRMDYSLLIGVEPLDADAVAPETAVDATSGSAGALDGVEQIAEARTQQDCFAQTVFPSVDGRERFHVAVVDFAQAYNTKKRLAHLFKRVRERTDAHLSTVPPDTYAQRFLIFTVSLFE